MRAILSGLGIFLIAAGAGPAAAGMKGDLADCTRSDDIASANACTRVIESGRLRRADHFIGYFNRGWGYRNAGEDRKALADFDRSAKLKPGHAEIFYSRALTHHDLGNRDAALADLDRYAELKPDHWMTHYNRGFLFRKRGEYQNALSELDRAADLNPSEQRISILRAIVLSETGDQAAAREILDAIIVATPKNAQAYYGRALVSHAEGKTDSAVSDLEKASGLQQEFPAVHALLGRIAEARDDKTAAQRHYEAALSTPPKSFDGKWAQDEARARVSALGGEPVAGESLSSHGGEVAAKEPVPSGGCRKFIPSVGISVPTACE